MEYKVGDKVHVEFDAEVIGDWTSSSNRLYTLTLREISVGSGVHYVYLHEGNATVIDSEPRYWPPKTGDIWEAKGNEYFVYTGFSDAIIAYPVAGTDGNGLHSYGSKSFDDFKALKPTLIRRKGVTFDSYLTPYGEFGL